MGFICGRPLVCTADVRRDANVTYYAVDHSPSYLWDSATWAITEAVLPDLPTVIAGRDGWQADQTARRGDRDPLWGCAESEDPVLPKAVNPIPACSSRTRCP
jgi:hypothetical protein